MANSGYDVSALSEYIKQNEDVLIKEMVIPSIKGDSVEKMRKQLGIKTKERLNYLSLDPTLQAGGDCGFTPKGSTVFTERDIVTKQVKIQDEYCPDQLLGKFAEYLVNIGAGKETLPFEGVIMNELVRKTAEKIEKAVWQGDTTLGIDGLLKIADTGGADAASTVKVDIAKGTSIYDAVKAVYMAMPEELLDKGFIGLSPANFRKFTAELLEKNFYHYPSAVNENAKVFIFPGSDVEVREIQGLKGKDDVIYASVWENIVYGTDLMSDSETVKGWFSDDNQTFRINVKFNFGVQTLYPDMIVLGKIATV